MKVVELDQAENEMDRLVQSLSVIDSTALSHCLIIDVGRSCSQQHLIRFDVSESVDLSEEPFS